MGVVFFMLVWYKTLKVRKEKKRKEGKRNQEAGTSLLYFSPSSSPPFYIIKGCHLESVIQSGQNGSCRG